MRTMASESAAYKRADIEVLWTGDAPVPAQLSSALDRLMSETLAAGADNVSISVTLDGAKFDIESETAGADLPDTDSVLADPGQELPREDLDRDDLDAFLDERMTDPSFARGYAGAVLAAAIAGVDGKDGNPDDWREIADALLEALEEEFAVIPRRTG